MDVNAAIGRHLKDLFRDDLSKSNDNDHIGIIFPQLCHARLAAHPSRLKDRNAKRKSRLLYRSRLRPAAPSFRLIRLGDCQHDLMLFRKSL